MRGHILIIDDNSMDVKIVTNVLELKGYACHGFTNGDEGLAWLDSNEAQLIFLDLQMPKISGYELITKIRQNPIHKETPILIISGKNQAPDIKKAISLGANDYIIKPLDLLVLQEKVQKLEKGEESEFTSIELSKENPVQAYIGTPIYILSLSEFGMKIQSDTSITPGQVIELLGLSKEIFATERVLVRCLSSQKIDATEKSVAQLTFVGMSEQQRQIIRIHIRKLSLQEKGRFL